jgi:hypothetical protein
MQIRSTSTCNPSGYSASLSLFWQMDAQPARHPPQEAEEALLRNPPPQLVRQTRFSA